MRHLVIYFYTPAQIGRQRPLFIKLLFRHLLLFVGLEFFAALSCLLLQALFRFAYLHQAFFIDDLIGSNFIPDFKFIVLCKKAFFTLIFADRIGTRRWLHLKNIGALFTCLLLLHRSVTRLIKNRFVARALHNRFIHRFLNTWLLRLLKCRPVAVIFQSQFNFNAALIH